MTVNAIVVSQLFQTFPFFALSPPACLNCSTSNIPMDQENPSERLNARYSFFYLKIPTRSEMNA
jgi:hypothetical protein